MSKDVKMFAQGCDARQRNKTSNQAPITDPQMLQAPARRWGSVSTDFIVKLPKTKEGFDAITTWVDRLSRRAHFMPCHTTGSAIEVAKDFYEVGVVSMGCQMKLLQTEIQNSSPSFGKS